VIEVTSRVELAVDVAAPPAQVFARLQDIPDVARHFPAVTALEPAGPGAFRWRHAVAGVPPVRIAAVYACRYVPDPTTRTITWTALPQAPGDNARVEGAWRVGEAPGGRTRLGLENGFTLRLELPRLLRAVAEPIVARENRLQVEQFLAGVVTSLSGGDGRRW
jgi:carbon monoxide dehydrogenase subunit G